MSKVYAVMGGYDYEGEQFHSLRLFDCLSTATAYKVELESGKGAGSCDYDYAVLETREVNLESALLCAA